MSELDFIQQARWFAAHRGFKPAWAYVAFKNRYGKWPNDLFKTGEPKEASQEFLDWVHAYWAVSTS